MQRLVLLSMFWGTKPFSACCALQIRLRDSETIHRIRRLIHNKTLDFNASSM